jgi:SulP family sulfate permease
MENGQSTLLCDSDFSGRYSVVKDNSKNWDGTPGLRKLWLNQPSLKPNVINNDEHNTSTVYTVYGSENQVDESIAARTISSPKKKNTVKKNFCDEVSFYNFFSSTPGLIIAMALNLFMSMSFGQAFFPTEWVFPAGISSAIGVQMFLFSTIVCQLVMTTMSDFSTAMGCMMVENIPFMHIMCKIILSENNNVLDETIFSTIFVTYGLTSIAVGLFFYLLGKFKIGNSVYFFPRHVIIGCIGGIGIFIIQTSIEVSTNKTWVWSFDTILNVFLNEKIGFKILATCGFETVLRIILSIFHAPLFPPFYFISIPPLFYFILYIFGISVDVAHENNWFFKSVEQTNFLQIWTLIDFSVVNWSAIGKCVPTIIALTIFRFFFLKKLLLLLFNKNKNCVV